MCISWSSNSTVRQEEAVRQIKEKGYALPYAADKRRILALGINFSSEKGTIDGFLCEEMNDEKR